MGVSMSNNETLNQNQPNNRRKAVCNRLRRLAKYAETIKKDLQRDCVPFWKLDQLAEDLLDIREEIKELED